MIEGMTETAPILPAHPSLTDTLGNCAKVLPVLALLVACYSVEFEIIVMAPHGLGLLAYYSWQDYLRTAMVWFPVVIIAFVVALELLIAAAAFIHLFMLNNQKQRELNKLEVALGHTPTPPGLLRSIFIRPDWRGYIVFIVLVGITAMLIWMPKSLNIFTSVSLGLATNIIMFGGIEMRRIFQIVLPDLWSRSNLGALALFFAALVGALAGYTTTKDLNATPPAKITIKSDQGATKVADGCHILRVLSAALLASCKGTVIAINSSIVEMVEYPK